MSNNLTIPTPVAMEATHQTVKEALAKRERWGGRNEVEISPRDLTDDVLADLVKTSQPLNKSFYRVVSAIAAGRKGDFKAIPRFSAAPDLILTYLRHGLTDGWVYQRTASGGLRAYMVTGVETSPGRNPQDPDAVVINAVFNSITGDGRGGGPRRKSWHVEAGSLVRRTPAAVLEGLDLMKETPDLRAEYDQHVEDYRVLLTTGFAKQFRYTGQPISYTSRDRWGSPNPLANAKVVHDVAPHEIGSFQDVYGSALVDPDEDPTTGRQKKGVLPVPLHFDLRVFHLGTHMGMVVDSRGLSPYTYDKSLREKLVLPADQRDLLDILTEDISTFTSDLIEGKSAGNVILCKGIPGVGKTLSAEVYAELTERPLYSIHSGSLGVTAASVRENLEIVFQRSQRLDMVLLLDEADVFVIERGDNLEQNAIVAEFLRTMEYYQGLMFMTTNRADSVDEAIISRCAAIIDYRVPGRDDARKIWHVLAGLSNTTLDEGLVDELLDGFPHIAPRDIKMLLRLTLRVALAKKVPLTVDVFRQCAMFRGLHFEETE